MLVLFSNGLTAFVTSSPILSLILDFFDTVCQQTLAWPKRNETGLVKQKMYLSPNNGSSFCVVCYSKVLLAQTEYSQWSNTFFRGYRYWLDTAVFASSLREFLSLSAPTFSFCDALRMDLIAEWRKNNNAQTSNSWQRLVRAKSPTETLLSVQQVYGGESMSRSLVFEWHKRFCEGPEEVDDHDPKIRTICFCQSW